MSELSRNGQPARAAAEAGEPRMRWSWHLGRIAGIDVFVHATLLILIVWIVLANSRVAAHWIYILLELVFVALVFGTIVLHELGHALAARRYGIQTRDIILLPIGGVARLERMPEASRQELVVALAGPAVNGVLACLLYLILQVADQTVVYNASLWEIRGNIFVRLFWTNVVLAVFNLLPAFPMDGGRVLRAALGFFMDYATATQAAAAVGQGMALLLGFVGLMAGHPLLVFVALFVWIGAGKESQDVQLRALFKNIPVREVMVRSFQTLSTEDSLRRAVQLTLDGFQIDFPVLAPNGEVCGILTRGAMLKALAERGENVSIGEVMERKFSTAAPDEMMQDVFLRMPQEECRSVPVVDRTSLVGILTSDNIGEYVMIEYARR